MRRNSTSAIQPFPDNIDRNHFASWLSGFTDGEASFTLALQTRKNCKRRDPTARFFIGLRADDDKILHTIQSFFQCGYIHYSRKPTSKVNNAKPVCMFHVGRISDLMLKIVPHYERYPLIAKKANDFDIWKPAVAIAYQVSLRKRIRRSNHSNGTVPKWSDDEYEAFKTMMLDLKRQRNFKQPKIEQKPAAGEKLPLFTGLD